MRCQIQNFSATNLPLGRSQRAIHQQLIPSIFFKLRNYLRCNINAFVIPIINQKIKLQIIIIFRERPLQAWAGAQVAAADRGDRPTAQGSPAIRQPDAGDGAGSGLNGNTLKVVTGCDHIEPRHSAAKGLCEAFIFSCYQHSNDCAHKALQSFTSLKRQEDHEQAAHRYEQVPELRAAP